MNKMSLLDSLGREDINDYFVLCLFRIYQLAEWNWAFGMTWEMRVYPKKMVLAK